MANKLLGILLLSFCILLVSCVKKQIDQPISSDSASPTGSNMPTGQATPAVNKDDSKSNSTPYKNPADISDQANDHSGKKSVDQYL